MDKFEQLFQRIDNRFTTRRAEIRLERAAKDSPVLCALENELLEQQIRFRTDHLLIDHPHKPLGRFFFWKVSFKTFLHRHSWLKFQ